MLLDSHKDEDEEHSQAHGGADGLQVQERQRDAAFAFFLELFAFHDVACLVVVVSQDGVGQQVHQLLDLVLGTETEFGNLLSEGQAEVVGVLSGCHYELDHILARLSDFLS